MYLASVQMDRSVRSKNLTSCCLGPICWLRAARTADWPEMKSIAPRPISSKVMAMKILCLFIGDREKVILHQRCLPIKTIVHRNRKTVRKKSTAIPDRQTSSMTARRCRPGKRKSVSVKGNSKDAEMDFNSSKKTVHRFRRRRCAMF